MWLIKRTWCLPSYILWVIKPTMKLHPSSQLFSSTRRLRKLIMWHWQYSCWWLYWRLPGHAPGSSRSPAEPIRHCSPGLWCPSRTWQVQEEITLFTLMEGEQESSWEDKRTEEIGWGVRRLKRGWNEEGKGKFWEQAGRSDNDPACSDLCLQLASPQHSVYIGYNINPVYKWLSDLCN